jgi:hypothetical protein
LKSHGPRTFERAENSLEHRGPQVFIQDARARYAVLKVPAETLAHFLGSSRRRRYGSIRSRAQRTGTRSADRARARRPLPQNRAVKTGLHDVSVVPATARPIQLRRALTAGWCTRVEGGRDATYTSARRRNFPVARGQTPRTGQCVP